MFAHFDLHCDKNIGRPRERGNIDEIVWNVI
jgi:hypothetical protein